MQNKNDAIIYHEKQNYWQCGLHAVNNILQDKIFNKEDFDKIANDLHESSTKDISFFNPHKSLIIGNYDANVLMIALQSKGYQADYYNQSKNKTFKTEDYTDVQGFILNIVTDWLFTKKKHWVAILKKEQFYYNLDSKREHHTQQNSVEIENYINNILSKQGTLLIVKNKIHQ